MGGGGCAPDSPRCTRLYVGRDMQERQTRRGETAETDRLEILEYCVYKGSCTREEKEADPEEEDGRGQELTLEV